MIAIDTSCLIAIALREPEAESFLRILTQEVVLIGWPTVFETNLVLQANRIPKYDLFLHEILSLNNVRFVPFDAQLYEFAKSGSEKFGRGRHPARLNFGDCMAYAVAKAHDAPLLFKGADFRQTDINVHPAAVA